MAYVRDSFPSEDSEELAPKLREADKRELSAISDRPYRDTLYLGAVVSSPARTIIHEDEVIGMYGVAPAYGFNLEYGCIWCLASDKLTEIKYQFLKQSISEVRDMEKNYKKLINFVHADNTTSIRWLKFLGFKVSPTPVILGIKQEPFYYFER